MQEETESVSRLEGIVEQINERLNHVDTEISELRREMQDGFRDIRKAISSGCLE